MTATEIVIRLKRVPHLHWGRHRLDSPGHDDIVLRIGRQAGVSVYLRAKTPGKEVSRPVSLDLDFAEELGEPPQPYERLLADALRGDSTLFPRWSVIEETWRIVQPLLDVPPRVEMYQPGTWGPISSHDLAARHGGWREPQVRRSSASVRSMTGWSEWAGDVEVEPSIYASDFSRLGAELGALTEVGARVFHFDVGDGHFIPEITIGPIVLASISPLVRGWGARLDCHLMVSEPERHFEAVAKAGGDSVTFHVEACDAPEGLSRVLARSDSVWVSRSTRRRRSKTRSLRLKVPISCSACRFIPATRGRSSCPTRWRESPSYAPASLEPRIQVDGGIHRETIAWLVRRVPISSSPGARVFWNDDPAFAYRELVEAAGG